MTVFVDTSALIALLDEDDRWHAEAARSFRWLASNAIVATTNYVQVETVALVRRRLGPSAVQRLVGAIFPVMTTVWVDAATHSMSLAAHLAGGRPSLVDQVSFAVMRQQGIQEVLAFDRDFELEGFQMAVAVPGWKGVYDVAVSYGRVSEAPELVSVSEISARAGRPVNTVQSWRRRHADFPQPVAQLAAGPIWNWSTVEAWVAGRARRSRSSDRSAARSGSS